MKLQTIIPLKKQERNLIDYNSKLLLLGSCFSENIGDKFEYFKFQSVSNPLGILFHPKAIETLVVRAVEKKYYTTKDLFFYNEQWHCYDAHSKCSATSKEDLLNTLNTGLESTYTQLSEASHIIITLGTAWVYNVIESGKTVANCHKVPQKQFNKRLLSVNESLQSLQSIIGAIQQINKTASVIFTVSPVRHIKDGFVENARSKAHLLSAIHQVVEQHDYCFYFPSYEIMLDELREYRFYNTDMLHPNETAIQYIWEKFKLVWLSEDSTVIMKQVETIQNGLSHRPFNKSAIAHKVFLETLETKKQRLNEKLKRLVF